MAWREIVTGKEGINHKSRQNRLACFTHSKRQSQMEGHGSTPNYGGALFLIARHKFVDHQNVKLRKFKIPEVPQLQTITN